MLLFARVAGAEVGPFAGSGSTKMSNVGCLAAPKEASDLADLNVDIESSPTELGTCEINECGGYSGAHQGMSSYL